MKKINELTIDVRGTLTQPNPTNLSVMQKLVYQACSPQFANYTTKHGQPRMVRAYVKVINPKTPAQLLQQAKLRAGVSAWQAASLETRALYAPIAEKRAITLYMAFLGEFMKSFTPPIGAQWDSGRATWDSGTATWE